MEDLEGRRKMWSPGVEGERTVQKSVVNPMPVVRENMRREAPAWMSFTARCRGQQDRTPVGTRAHSTDPRE